MRSKIAALVAAGALLVSAQPTQAADATPIVAGPGAIFAGYATRAAVTFKGGDLRFVNLDAFAHDVISVDYGPDTQPWCEGYAEGRCPVLFAEMTSIGGESKVHGTENLAPGKTYEFYCSPHKAAMRGTLVVAG